MWISNGATSRYMWAIYQKWMLLLCLPIKFCVQAYTFITLNIPVWLGIDIRFLLKLGAMGTPSLAQTVSSVCTAFRIPPSGEVPNPEAFPEALGDVGSICPVRVFHQSRFPDVWRERGRDQLQLLDREYCPGVSPEPLPRCLEREGTRPTPTLGSWVLSGCFTRAASQVSGERGDETNSNSWIVSRWCGVLRWSNNRSAV